MKDVAEMAVKLMAASARTAPKAGGKDFLEIVVITRDEDLKKIAESMKAYAPKSTNEAYWLRDASNIESSQALLLVGLAKPVTAGYDCGGCGYTTPGTLFTHAAHPRPRLRPMCIGARRAPR